MTPRDRDGERERNESFHEELPVTDAIARRAQQRLPPIADTRIAAAHLQLVIDHGPHLVPRDDLAVETMATSSRSAPAV